ARDIYARIVGGHFRNKARAEEKLKEWKDKVAGDKREKDLISATIDFYNAIINYEEAWLSGEGSQKELKQLRKKGFKLINLEFEFKKQGYELAREFVSVLSEVIAELVGGKAKDYVELATKIFDGDREDNIKEELRNKNKGVNDQTIEDAYTLASYLVGAFRSAEVGNYEEMKEYLKKFIAHQLWIEGGRQEGQAESDWQEAEKILNNLLSNNNKVEEVSSNVKDIFYIIYKLYHIAEIVGIKEKYISNINAPIKETLGARQYIMQYIIKELGRDLSEHLAMRVYLNKKVHLNDLQKAQEEVKRNPNQKFVRVKIGWKRYAYFPVEIINNALDVKVAEAIGKLSAQELEIAWNKLQNGQSVVIEGIVIDNSHSKWKDFVYKQFLLKNAFSLLSEEEIMSLEVGCENNTLKIRPKEGSKLKDLLSKDKNKLSNEEREKVEIVNKLIEEFNNYNPVSVNENSSLGKIIEEAKNRQISLEGIYVGNNSVNDIDFDEIEKINKEEEIRVKNQIIARIAKDSILKDLDKNSTTAVIQILARTLKEGFEFIRNEYKDNHDELGFGSPKAKKVTERLQMVWGLLSEQSIGLEAGGGKTLGGAMEYIVWSLLNPQANMVWVVKTGEVSELVNPYGEKGRIVRPLLARFGLELVNGDQEMLALRGNGDFSELKEALSNPNKIVVFSQTQFGHIRNINDQELLEKLITQDILRIDELHIPFSDRVTFIIGSGNKHIDEALAEEGLSRETIERAYDWVNRLNEDSDKNEVAKSKDSMVYHGPDGKFGLNEKAMEEMRKQGYNPSAVYACLEARFSDVNRYEFVDGVPKPKDRGEVQIDKVISDPVYLAALVIKEERENEKRGDQDKVKIDWDKIYVTETTHQATLSEVLRFSPFTSVLGYSGTLAGVEMLHRLHLGRGVFVISDTIFNAQVLQVESKDRIEEVVKLVRAHLEEGKGMLIFCYDEKLLQELRKELNREFGNDKIKVIDGQTPEISNDDNIWDINRLQKEVNANTIILSNVRGATGYSYEGERDLLVVDGENWTYSDLLQAIYRNNRQGEKASRTVFCDSNNFIQYRLPKEVKEKIEKEMNRPLLSQEGKTRNDIISGTLSSSPFNSGNNLLKDLLTNTHYRDIINISEALLHNSREALHSLIIESIKIMLHRAEEFNGDKDKVDSEKSKESKFLEAKLREAIRNRYEVKDGDLALSPYSLEGEDVLRQNIMGVLHQAEKIFDEIARNENVSNLSRLEARRLRDSARNTIRNYDSFKNNTIQDSMCFQKARSFEDIVITARSFEERILPEAVRVPGDVSRNPKIAKVVEEVKKLSVEGGKEPFDKKSEEDFYKDIHHRLLRGDEILTPIAQMLKSHPATGPPQGEKESQLPKLILDLYKKLSSEKDENTPIIALPSDKKLAYIKAVYQYVIKEVYNQEDLTDSQKKDLADTLAFLAIPQITPFSNYTDKLTLAVSIGEIYCGLLAKVPDNYKYDPKTGDWFDSSNPTIRGKIVNGEFSIYGGGLPQGGVEQKDTEGWTKSEVLDALMNNPGYFTLHLELSRRRVPIVSPNWWARRSDKKQKPILDELTSFILDHPLKGNRDVRRLNRFIRKYEDYRGNKLPHKFDEAIERLSKLLRVDSNSIDKDALRFTFAYLSYTHPTKLSNWERISQAKKLVESWASLNIPNFDPEEFFYNLAGLPDFGQVKEAWYWIMNDSKTRIEKRVSKRAKFKSVLEMVRENNNPKFLQEHFNDRERKTDLANPKVMAKKLRIPLIVNFLINLGADLFGLIDWFSSATGIHQIFARILLFMGVGILFFLGKWLVNKFAQLPLRKEKKILNAMHKAIEQEKTQRNNPQEKEQVQLTLEMAKKIAEKIAPHTKNEDKYYQVLGMILWFSSFRRRTAKIEDKEYAIIGNDGKVNIEAVKALVGELDNLSESIQATIKLLPEEDQNKYNRYLSLSFLVDPRNEKNIEYFKEEAKRSVARRILNEVIRSEVANKEVEKIRKSIASLKNPNSQSERLKRISDALISENKEVMKFLFGEDDTNNKIYKFLQIYAEELATEILEAIDEAEKHFGFKENKGIATGFNLDSRDREDEIKEDFSYTIRKILEDNNKTPEDKVMAIESLCHTTERDLKVHLRGKDKLKELLGDEEDILSGFIFEGITNQFMELILSKIKDENTKNKVKEELEKMMTNLVSMIERWADAEVEREGKVGYWQKIEDEDVKDVFTKTFENIKTLIAGLKSIEGQTEQGNYRDYSSVIKQIEEIIKDLEDTDRDNQGVNFGVGLKEAGEVINDLLNKKLGEAKEEIRELLIAYRNLLTAWNNDNRTPEEWKENNTRRMEEINAMISQLNNWDEKEVTDQAIKVEVNGNSITLKELLKGLIDAIEPIEDKNQPALVCLKSILELAQKSEAQKVVKLIQEKVEAINEVMKEAEDIVRIRNRGSQTELINKDYDIKRKVAEYEYYRRTLLFLYNVPVVLKVVIDEDGNVTIEGLSQAVKAVFNKLDDKFVIENTEENLNKFLYLLRLGEKGKIPFSEIGEEVWRMNYEELKGKYDIHEKEDVEFTDENAQYSRGKLILDKYIDNLREYKDELSRLNLNKKNNKEEINKAKKFLEEKDLSELSKYLLPKSESEKKVIIGKLDDLINDLETNKKGALTYVIESLAVTFEIEKSKTTQHIIGLILKGKIRKDTNGEYELNLGRIINKLNKVVYAYRADNRKILSYYANPNYNNPNKPLLIMNKEGKIFILLDATPSINNNSSSQNISIYWLVLDEKGEVKTTEPIDGEFTAYSPIQLFEVEDNDTKWMRKNKVTGILQFTPLELEEDLLGRKEREIIKKYSPWLLSKEEISIEVVFNKLEDLLNNNSNNIDFDNLNYYLSLLSEELRVSHLKEEEIEDEINKIKGKKLNINNKEVYILYLNGLLRAYVVDSTEEFNGKRVYHLKKNLEDKEIKDVEEEIELPLSARNGDEIYIFEDVVKRKAEQWRKEHLRQTKDKNKRAILRRLSKVEFQEIEEFIHQGEIIKQQRQINGCADKNPLWEERIIDLIIIGDNKQTEGVRKLAFLHLLFDTIAIDDWKYVKWVFKQLKIEWNGEEKTLTKAIKRIDFENIYTKIDVDFNTENVNEEVLFTFPTDYYEEKLKQYWDKKDNFNMEKALDMLLGSVEFVCEFHNPLNTLIEIVLDNNLDKGIRNKAMDVIAKIAENNIKFITLSDIVTLLSLLSDEDQELRNKFSSLLLKWTESNEVSLEDIKVGEEAVEIKPANQKQLNDFEISAIIARINGIIIEEQTPQDASARGLSREAIDTEVRRCGGIERFLVIRDVF
ncbi:MAG: DUF2934 domain-containing protein, partial [Candidatus Omnitrophica bacterium]|nr:DUF2934 domain-containing protein [Candidatus Omnitrophota bacterium]